jgi:hypothetical protein
LEDLAKYATPPESGFLLVAKFCHLAKRKREKRGWLPKVAIFQGMFLKLPFLDHMFLHVVSLCILGLQEHSTLLSDL